MSNAEKRGPVIIGAVVLWLASACDSPASSDRTAAPNVEDNPARLLRSCAQKPTPVCAVLPDDATGSSCGLPPEVAAAPALSASTRYGIHLVVRGGSGMGAVVFTPSSSGFHTLYLGTPRVPLSVAHDGTEVAPSEDVWVTSAASCLGRRALTYDLQAQVTYSLVLGPIRERRWVGVFIDPPAATGCGPARFPGLAEPIVLAASLPGDGSTNLYTLRGDGSGLTRLTDTTEAELFPRWSPDHRRIAFVREGQLFVADADGGPAIRVAEVVGRNGEAVTAAAWSPDGTELVYPFARPPFIVSSDDEVVDQSYETTLHFVNADGTGDRAFLEPPEAGAPPGVGTLIEPAWSPLGPIAFNVLDDCPDCAGGSYYATALPDGSEFQQVVPPGDPVSPYPIHGLDWSPDGTRWVYTAFARYALYESPGIIVTSTASHTDPRTLTAADAWMPHWSPDGEWIVFLRADGLYLVAADGCHERRLLEAPGIRGVDW